MVVKELATIWMSSTAIDMPRHIAAKPIQTFTMGGIYAQAGALLAPV